MNSFKDYAPNDVKKDTCAAVAYSILTGLDYDNALKILPNGEYNTIKRAMDKLGLDPIEGNGQTLQQFSQQNRRGKYFVCLIKNNNNMYGHAIAIIDGVGYNMQSFGNQSIIDRYYDFSKISKTTNDTAYTDEDNKSSSLSKNRYVIYAYQSIINLAADKLYNNFGKINTRVVSKNSNGFSLVMNGKSVDFTFPLNCTDREVLKEIDSTIQQFIKKL